MTRTERHAARLTNEINAGAEAMARRTGLSLSMCSDEIARLTSELSDKLAGIACHDVGRECAG